MAVDKRTARFGMLATIALILFGLLGVRLWFLQGEQADEYQAKVTSAKTRTVYVAPLRGRIFDAEGRVVADNQRFLTVTVDWSVIRKQKNRLELFTRLSGPLKTPVDDLMRRHDPCYKLPEPCNKGQLFDTLLPLPLKEDVDEATVNYLMERSENYPGIDVVEQYRRVYPYAPIASHVIGFMGAITAESLDDYLDKGYKRNERVGQFGVELSMERELHGEWGKRVYEIDASGAIVREMTEERIEPKAGYDIQLTIDLKVQQYAEQALETELRLRRKLPEDLSMSDSAPYNPLDREKNWAVRVYQRTLPDGTKIDYPEWVQHKAPAGSVVVENHLTGHIVAMASYPSFDNRWINAGISQAKYQQLFPNRNPDGSKVDPDRSVIVNRAVQGNYNLGSSIKPFVAWSALHSGIINAYDTWTDEGFYTLFTIPPENCLHNGGVAKCIFKNATNKRSNRPSSYGPVTVPDALAVSSDCFFYRIGEMFYAADENLLQENLRRFGFGAETGVQLPYEWAGRLPSDEVKAELVELGVLAENEVPRLVVGDAIQMAIGQGLMAVTPLQLTNAYATLANGGFLLKPTIVKNILAPLTPDKGPAMADLEAGEVVQSFEQRVVVDQLEMPMDTVYKPIIDGLTRVIRGPGVYWNFLHETTGERLFRGFPAQIAGKTGTAQGAANLPWNDSSVFGAFGVPDLTSDAAPTLPYTVVAYLEKSGYGSKAAAPVVKCMFLALTGNQKMDEVLISDPLDTSQFSPAPQRSLKNPYCLGGSSGLKD
jgi:penicillin-binding protein 2